MNLLDTLLELPLLLPRPPGLPKDRRATARVRLALSIEEQVSGENLRRKSYDLSTFGMALLAGPDRTQGSLLRLRLHLPDGEPTPLALDAEVLGVHAPTGGMRVAFRDPSDDALKRIHRLVDRLSRFGWLRKRI